MQDYESGTITVKGRDIKHDSIHSVRKQGVSHVPEDRMTYGIMGDASIKENLIADRYYSPEYCKGGLLNAKKMNEDADQYIKEYLVKCDDREQPVRMLSGGNIQKVVAAREFSSKPDLAVICQPTRGIDVGTISVSRL